MYVQFSFDDCSNFFFLLFHKTTDIPLKDFKGFLWIIMGFLENITQEIELLNGTE